MSQKLEELELQHKKKTAAVVANLSDTPQDEDDDDDFKEIEMTIDDDEFYSITPNKSSQIKDNIPNHSTSTPLIKNNNNLSKTSSNTIMNDNDNNKSILSTKKPTTITIEDSQQSHDIDNESIFSDDLDMYIDDINIPSKTTIAELRKLMDDLEHDIEIPKNKTLCKVVVIYI